MKLSVWAVLLLFGLFDRANADDSESFIAGDTFVSLDGTWQVSGQATSPISCAFEQGVDYDDPSLNRVVPAPTKEDCCVLCSSDPLCARAVFNGDAYKQCYFKSSRSTKKSSSSNNWSCEATGGGEVVRNLTFAGRVPGDLITDLQAANIIGDPYYELNFLNSSLWNNRFWTYTREFSTPQTSQSTSFSLVLEGVKMGATIRLNGVDLGVVYDQFLRNVFHLSDDALRQDGAQNILEVIFDNNIECHSRWMSCTGGWDWAPYSNTFLGAAPTFSRGIWRSVYLVGSNSGSTTIQHLVPETFYLGEYPTAPLIEKEHGGFRVDATVWFDSAQPTSGVLQVVGEWGASATQTVTLKSGTQSITVSLAVGASDIDLWWPVGAGSHTLYWINASFTPVNAPSAALVPRVAPPKTVTTSRRIGFRTFAIVTGNDTDPNYVARAANEEGSDNQGMAFRVNGALIFSRGANMIPMEELEGRMDDTAHALLVASAAAANMNTLRVWGGGMFLPDSWYDACDANGVLVYHDMQVGSGGPHDNAGPVPYSPTVMQELQYQIRRLSHHPSIVIWDGCNECGGQDMYAAFIMTTVVGEDSSRSVWPSCPSSGWYQGVDKLTQIPNGNRLFPKPNDGSVESHGPYFHGSGLAGVNGGGSSKVTTFNTQMPIAISETKTGPQFKNHYTSEFGASVFSSFESISPTLDKAHWGVHGGAPADTCTGGFASTCTGSNVMSQRNYPCDGITVTYFGTQDFESVGQEPFQKQLYLCMVAQTMIIKQQIEVMRSTNTFGMMLWQLNEIWPTGGWGTIEYGSPRGTPGQVIGGRWKPLHHILESSLYRDVMATCGAEYLCYVRNDSPTARNVRVDINSIELASGIVSLLWAETVSLPAGAGVTHWFQFNGSKFDSRNQIMTATVWEVAGRGRWNDTNSQLTELSRTVVHMAAPKDMNIPKSTVTLSISDQPNPDGSVDVHLTSSNGVSLYVTLTTQAQGRFSSNSILLLPNSGNLNVVTFKPFLPNQFATLKATTRVEHLGGYL